jgi:hypothetical protein
MDMGFAAWNVWRLYRAFSLKTVARELAKCKLDLVTVQVRWVEGGSQPAYDYKFLYGNGTANRQLRIGFFIHNGIRSAVKRVEFINDRK